MNKKNNKILIILAVILVAVCLVYVIVTKVQEAGEARKESESKAESEASRIFVTDISAADAVTLKTGDAELKFVKKDDTWYYDGDDKFPTDQDTLNTIADAAAKFEVTRKLENGDSLEDYGFADDNISVEVSNADGDSAALEYGKSVNDGYYVKTADSDTVYTADSVMYNVVSGKTLYDFIEMESLPNCYSDQIEQVKITLDGETYTYDKPQKETDGDADTDSSGGTGGSADTDGSGGTGGSADTDSSDGAGGSADTDSAGGTGGSSDTAESEVKSETETETESPEEEAFNNLSSAIPGMSIEKCVNYYVEKDGLKEYGLDKPAMTIEYTFTNSDAQIKTQVIYVGNKASGDDAQDGSESYYIRLKGSDAVNTISANSIEGLKDYIV